MKKIKANSAHFIKLGQRGFWEERCILKDSTLRLGFDNPLHKECLQHDWDKVRQYWLQQGKTQGKATEATNQIKTFYESDQDILWITFFRRRMYWCFAHKKITKLKDGSRIRDVNGKWKYQDINGSPLFVDNLSGKLTKVQAFRGTICAVKEFDYLLRKINGEKLPEVQKAQDTLNSLILDIIPLIKNLSWKDFELLVDLIFAQSGWQRISTLDKTEKFIDLDLISPVTGNRAFVQIKSQADINKFRNCIKQYKTMKQYNEMYFVVHTTNGSFNTWQDTTDVKLFDVNKLSNLVVTAGLTNWLIQKTS